MRVTNSSSPRPFDQFRIVKGRGRHPDMASGAACLEKVHADHTRGEPMRDTKYGEKHFGNGSFATEADLRTYIAIVPAGPTVQNTGPRSQPSDGCMMRRRNFIGLLGGAAAIWPMQLRAQQVPGVVIGVLHASSEQATSRQFGAFRAAMRQLGYVEGSNIRFVYRFADGFLDRLPGLAAELVQLNPRIIVSAPMPANLALRNATTTIPIVMADGADPVSFGLVQSLSHPGGNVTGLTNFAEDLAAKQLDMMRELLPRLARVAVLINVENPLHAPQWRETQAAAARAAIALIPFEIHSPDQLQPAFEGRGTADSAGHDLQHPSPAHRRTGDCLGSAGDLLQPPVCR